jgi:hypothetical protein
LTARIGFRLVGAGFAIGALVHAGEGFASMLGYHLRDYPLWRHGLFVVLDGGLAALAIRWPLLLWAPLLLLLAQQSSTHGRDVWETWRHLHGVAWLSLGTMTFVTASAILAVDYRWRGSTSTSPTVRRRPRSLNADADK